MLTEQGQYHSKASFFKLNFQNGILEILPSANKGFCSDSRIFDCISDGNLALFIKLLQLSLQLYNLAT